MNLLEIKALDVAASASFDPHECLEGRRICEAVGKGFSAGND